ncbi:CHRD domain-containing protein [Ottowia sp.]|uniref:CHRD domain-containing protein n=2 Tax=Ottowia sp. TaxID=1898956 RepID=UPI002B881682|nr:CHRD domain-containing protein [Ottowia sp.]HOB65506.1 CHRD domain-containing protein [Ottowia sp.]HPZ57254.1 CHRD domain-containing protein [Ottowia sp.]
MHTMPACVFSRVVLHAVLGAAVLAGLTACVRAPVQTAPPARSATPAAQRLPELAAFSARLSGAAAVPASDSAASGELVAVFNRHTGLLQWKLNFSALSGPVTGGYFHSPGMSGEVAPRAIMLGRTLVSPAEGRAMLTPKQRADLLAGQWYVNLITARYPSGELRGQLIEQH